jgi:AcrR family transcriptional regulator
VSSRAKTRTQTAARRPVGRPGDGGDVRGAILAAALRQLETTGSPHWVTVAAIIDEAGCTPPSLYHYWPKRELLLQEASAQGWALFRASQTGAVADHLEPIERLRLRGQAYLSFALAKPALFRVLFLEPAAAGRTDPTTDPTSDPTTQLPNEPTSEPQAQTGKALQELVTDVTAAMATGQLRPADPLTTALALWSAMHGVAALWAVTPNLPAGLAHAVGDLAQDAVLTGLAV